MNDSIWKNFRFIAIVYAIAGIGCLVCGQWLTAAVWFTTVLVAGGASYCIKKMSAELEDIKERMRCETLIMRCRIIPYTIGS